MSLHKPNCEYCESPATWRIAAVPWAHPSYYERFACEMHRARMVRLASLDNAYGTTIESTRLKADEKECTWTVSDLADATKMARPAFTIKVEHPPMVVVGTEQKARPNTSRMCTYASYEFFRTECPLSKLSDHTCKRVGYPKAIDHEGLGKVAYEAHEGIHEGSHGTKRVSWERLPKAFKEKWRDLAVKVLSASVSATSSSPLASAVRDLTMAEMKRNAIEYVNETIFAPRFGTLPVQRPGCADPASCLCRPCIKGREPL
jgi:hypothetical protein